MAFDSGRSRCFNRRQRRRRVGVASWVAETASALWVAETAETSWVAETTSKSSGGDSREESGWRRRRRRRQRLAAAAPCWQAKSDNLLILSCKGSKKTGAKASKQAAPAPSGQEKGPLYYPPTCRYQFPNGFAASLGGIVSPRRINLEEPVRVRPAQPG